MRPMGYDSQAVPTPSKLQIPFSFLLICTALLWACPYNAGTDSPGPVVDEPLGRAPSFGAPAAGPLPTREQMAEVLRIRLETLGVDAEAPLRGEAVIRPKELIDFYEERDQQTQWMVAAGPMPWAFDLPPLLQLAARNGMDPAHFHATTIDGLLTELGSKKAWDDAEERASLLVDTDILMSDAVLALGRSLAVGHVATQESDCGHRCEPADVKALLAKALDTDKVGKTLDELSVPHPEYAALRRALELYQRITTDGGWEQLPEGPTNIDENSPKRLTLLKNRLMITGDMAAGAPVPPALKSFQERHGLDPTGKLDKATVEALNTPVEKRAEQLRINLERWRWMPHDLGAKHVRVNIAGYWLQAFEDGDEDLAFRVIVGQSFLQTPVFSDEITYMVLNPTWTVTRNIASKEMLPILKKDPSYLARKNMSLTRGWNGPSTDPKSVDWSSYSEDHFPFVIRQRPGAGNALGRVKFMFPNPYKVYLHDTSAPKLFEKTTRSFSHGCIRAEKPLEMAEWLLSDQSEWDRGAIESKIATGKERTLRLSKAVPIHVLYFTSWIDEKERVHFRKDIYGRDDAIAVGLGRDPSKTRLGEDK